jgi:hypothetical protein
MTFRIDTTGIEVFLMSKSELEGWLRRKDSIWFDLLKEVPGGIASSISEDDAIENIAARYAGHYWWSCQPGCLPDGDPVGPFVSEAEAILSAVYNDVGDVKVRG